MAQSSWNFAGECPSSWAHKRKNEKSSEACVSSPPTHPPTHLVEEFGGEADAKLGGHGGNAALPPPIPSIEGSYLGHPLCIGAG
jgi:hypothetical protein